MGIRGLAVGLGLLVAGCGGGRPLSAHDVAGVPAPRGDLYRPPSPLRAAPPGTLIWAQRVSGLPLNPPGTIWRLLYHSRTRLGADVAVSGFAVVAESPAPAGGRPIYAWGHGSAGQGDQCAPSKHIRDNLPPNGGEVIERGGALVATDYDGLGTPGTPTYFDGVAEGRAVMDGVRALAALPGVGRPGPVILAGESQGGQAALFAAQQARSYAPELDVRGVVAMAPAAELVDGAEAVRRSASRGLIVAAADGLHAAYPALDPASFLTRQAVADLPRTERECIDATLARWRGTDPTLPMPVADVPALRAILVQNSPGAADPGVPILLVQGDRDEMVPVTLSARLEARYCRRGATVSRRVYPGVDHEGVADASRDDVLAWMFARLAGSAAPDDCVR